MGGTTSLPLLPSQWVCFNQHLLIAVPVLKSGVISSLLKCSIIQGIGKITMVRITDKLLMSRAEHNDGALVSVLLNFFFGLNHPEKVFVAVKHFQPSPMFASKTRTILLKGEVSLYH
jgi:hypothetical protein